MKSSTTMYYAGNNPESLLWLSLVHTVEMKTLTFALSVLGAIGVLSQWGFNNTMWTLAEERGQNVTANSTTSYSFREGLLYEEDNSALAKPYVWYTWIHFGWSSAFSGVALTSLIMLHYANFKWVRWDKMLYTALVSVVPTIIVFLVFGIMFAQAEPGTSDSFATLYLLCAFFVQIIPAVATPYMYAPVLKGLVTSPIKLSLLSILLTVVVALVVLDVITPIFASGGSTTRILIRLIAFPIMVEVPAGAVRTMSRFWMAEDFPLDRVLTALLGPVALSSLVGRFLSTNMATIGETIGVAVLLSAVELLMRVTMLMRDDFYVQCCGRPCGGKQAQRKKGRSENRAWVQFMLFETIYEDVGILLSLPVSLIFRIPPIPGGDPLGVGDIVVRVLIQLLIETMTDVGYSVLYYMMVRCGGVRYGAVTPVEMRARRRTTMLRFTENRRYLFLPKSLRRIARKSSAGKTATTASVSSAEPPRTASGAASPPLGPKSGAGKVTRVPDALLDDAPANIGAPAGSEVAPSTPVSTSTRPRLLSVETKASATAGPSFGTTVTADPGSSGAATPGPGATPGRSRSPPSPPPDLPSFWSCTPCCMGDDHPLVLHANATLRHELHVEARWEDEFIWEPVPLGLVAYQTSVSDRGVQEKGDFAGQWADEVDKRLRRDMTASEGATTLSQVSDDTVSTPKAGEAQDDAERGLAFDTLVAAENGTEPEQSLDDGFDPSLATLLTLRMELVALRFLRGWETRFKFMNLILAIGTFSGTLYVMRTFVGSLCPFGEAGDPATWKYDYCIPSA